MNAAWLDGVISPRAGRPFHSARVGLKMVATRTGTIRVRAVGQGTRHVLFVCDSPVVIEHYDALVELLQADFRILCLELPGMGFSRPRPGFDFSLAAQAQAVREVMEVEGVRDAILAFPCVGSYLALLLARELPDVIRGVVMIQAAAWPDEARWARRIDFHGRGVLATPIVGQLVVGAARRRLATRWFHGAAGDAASAHQLTEAAQAPFDAGAAWALASLTQAYFGGPAPSFQQVEQKALLVWGERDRTHRHSDPRSGLTYLPRGEFVLFEKAGHFPDLEESERFADLLVRFAASL